MDLEYELKVRDEAIRIAKAAINDGSSSDSYKKYLIGQIVALEAEKIRLQRTPPPTVTGEPHG